MTKEWVIKLHVFGRSCPGDKFQIPNDTFSDTLLPLGLKTEFLTQYNNSEKNCSVIYAVVGFYREKTTKQSNLFLGVSSEWIFFIILKFKLSPMQK